MEAEKPHTKIPAKCIFDEKTRNEAAAVATTTALLQCCAKSICGAMKCLYILNRHDGGGGGGGGGDDDDHDGGVEVVAPTWCCKYSSIWQCDKCKCEEIFGKKLENPRTLCECAARRIANM